MKKIIIITNKIDSHADALIKILLKLGQNVFRINTEDILSLDISLLLSSEKQSFRIQDKFDRMVEFDSEDIFAWFRKPEFDFKLFHKMDNEEHVKFVISQTKDFINTLYSLPNIKWINDPLVANKAKLKLQQLILAKQMGIKVPNTLITNNPKEAKIFFESNNQSILSKAIYNGNITLDGLNRGILSHKLTAKEFEENIESISICPVLLQEYIDKKYEARITVVGSKVFACRIDSQANTETRIDWRANTELNPHSILDLPKNIEYFCIDFLKKQGLVYGAFDFIITKEGEFVFLENNPFGQYLWVENIVGLPITEAIAEFLLGNNQVSTPPNTSALFQSDQK